MTAPRREILADGVECWLGDCREILPTLGSVDLVVTSPPYGQQRDYGSKINDWRSLVSGAITATPGEPQILVNLGLIHREGEVIEYWNDLIADMRAADWRFFGLYVWDQGSGMAGDWNGRLAPSFELVFHFNRNARRVNKTKPTQGGKIHGRGLRTIAGRADLKTHDGRPVNPLKIPDSVIRTPRETSGGYEAQHPARYPLPFAKELVEPFSDAGDVVMDPFLGSGTTGVAAVKLGKHFTGIEVEPRFFDIACRRITDALSRPDLFIEPPKPAKQEAML